MLLKAFIGGFYQTRSPYAGIDKAVNIFTEKRLVEGSPVDDWIYGTPGQKFNATLPTGPCRGWFSQDGQTWVVGGGVLYEQTDAVTYVSRGPIPDDGQLVTFASNGEGGEQLAVCGGGQVNVLDLLTNVLTTAVLPFSNPVMIVFQDGYGLVNERDTPKTWFCALEDFTSWDGLDFFARSVQSDNTIGMAVTRDRLFVIGSKTTTQYYDSGDADNPWAPYPGTTIQVGGVTWTAITVYNDVVRMLARSPKGEPRVVQFRADAVVQIISPPPIVDVLAACATLDDVEAMVYEQANHPFFVITCPSSPDEIQTYHCDLSEQNMWAARAGFDVTTGAYTRWRARGTTATNQQVYVGDYETGDLYTLDLNTYTDNGGILKRERIAPLLSGDPQWVYIRQAQLIAQVGVGLATGNVEDTDPQVELLISRDAAQTWVSVGAARLGKIGEYVTRVIWRNLGRFRADLAAIRLVQTAAVRCAWGPVALTTENGSGQL
jgi:hypothetical protein